MSGPVEAPRRMGERAGRARRPPSWSVPEDTDDLAAWRALLLAHAGAVRAIEMEVRRGGIPLTWYDVLLELNAVEGGRLRMQELSDRVVLSRTRVSRLVDEMVIAGLVTKRSDDQDRRSNWVSITAEGRRALRRTAPIYLRGIGEHFNRHLTAQERRVVARALSKVAQAHASPTPLGPRPARNPSRPGSRT